MNELQETKFISRDLEYRISCPVLNLPPRILNLRSLRNDFVFSAVRGICLLIVLSIIAVAQEPPPAQNFHQWGAVTLFNGLPSDNVRAVAQTPDGILWFGTDNGLAKFDGRRVTIVAVGDAAKIFALKVPRLETLWIGTDKGAYLLENNRLRLIEETKNFSITSIFPDDGKIWLGTNEGVVFAVADDEKAGTVSVEKLPRENLRGSDGNFLKITGFAKVGGRLIAGTRSRSILLIENDQVSETFSRPRPFFINALARDKQENVWLGADADDKTGGVFAVNDPGNLQRIEAETGSVSALAPDENGGVWVGTEKRGLFHFRGSRLPEHFTFENTAGGLRANNINAIFIDGENVVWLGTNRGVSRFDAASPFNRTLSENGNSNFVRTLFRDRSGQIYAGTNRGLFILSDTGALEANNFPGKIVYSISETTRRQTVVSTAGGLFSLDGKQILPGDVRAAVDFQGRTVAAVFGRGVVQLENQNVIFANDSPTALYADDENLWVGTARGEIFKYDGREAKPENLPETVGGSAIRKIFKDSDGNLWLAGERGLFRRRNGEFENILAGEDVRDFTVNAAEVWATTLKTGLFHARFDEQFGWLKSEINVEQGLPSEQTFSILPVDNHLLIATNRGIVTYTPSAIEPKIAIVRVLSQRLYEGAELAQLIALDYPQNSLLVEVAGLSSRTFPEQFQYTFLLKNSRGEILERRLSNEAQFATTNLAAGGYQIEARSFNKDLLTSTPLIINFSVARAPFPWTATALGVLLAIALVALIWAIIERRHISHKNRELAAARFDLANEGERERKRIAQDLHDQTLADLRNLMLMSDKIPSETGEFRREIESVSIEIRRICEDLSPSVLENVGLTAALEFLLSHTIENYQFTDAGDSEEKLNLAPNAQMQIYRIAQEVLTNIKRHSDARSVAMKIEISPEDQFILSIEDDGKMFNPEEIAAKGRGISNIKSRAALIEASVAWEKAETGGNTFRLIK